MKLHFKSFNPLYFFLASLCLFTLSTSFQAKSQVYAGAAFTTHVPATKDFTDVATLGIGLEIGVHWRATERLVLEATTGGSIFDIKEPLFAGETDEDSRYILPTYVQARYLIKRGDIMPYVSMGAGINIISTTAESSPSTTRVSGRPGAGVLWLLNEKYAFDAGLRYQFNQVEKNFNIGYGSVYVGLWYRISPLGPENPRR